MVTKLYKIGDLFQFEKGSLQSSKNTPGEYNFITASSDWKTHNTYSHNTEALVFAMGASGSLGRTHYVNGKFIASDLCYVLVPREELKKLIDLDFYHIYFNLIRSKIVRATATGTSKLAINARKFSDFEIVFPPIAEQRIIKNKIKLIQPKSERFVMDLVEAQHISKLLKNSILQEAIHGKLVTQDQTDEPAGKLVERIKIEKEQLIKEGKIKKDKSIPAIKSEEIPLELPKRWTWVRLEDISLNVHYGLSISAKSSDPSGVKLLRITDIQDNKVNWDSVPFCDCGEKQFLSSGLNNDDIVIARTGGTIGKSYIIKELKDKVVFASYLIRVIPSKYINADYLKLFIESPLYWKQLTKISNGTGQPNVNGTNLKLLTVPLPPYKEQKRIVEKVESLMKTCDEQEKNITEAKENINKLNQAILREMFN